MQGNTAMQGNKAQMDGGLASRTTVSKFGLLSGGAPVPACMRRRLAMWLRWPSTSALLSTASWGLRICHSVSASALLAAAFGLTFMASGLGCRLGGLHIKAGLVLWRKLCGASYGILYPALHH